MESNFPPFLTFPTIVERKATATAAKTVAETMAETEAERRTKWRAGGELA